MDPIRTDLGILLRKLDTYEVRLLERMTQLGRLLKGLGITVGKLDGRVRKLEERNSQKKYVSQRGIFRDKVTEMSSLLKTCQNKLDVIQILSGALQHAKKQTARDLLQTLYTGKLRVTCMQNEAKHKRICSLILYCRINKS